MKASKALAAPCSKSVQRLKTRESDIHLNQQDKTTPTGEDAVKLGLLSLFYLLKSSGPLAYWMELLSKEVSSSQFSEPPVSFLWKHPHRHTQRCAVPTLLMKVDKVWWKIQIDHHSTLPSFL